MEDNNDSNNEIAQIMIDFLDYLERFAAFRKENDSEIQAMMRRAEERNDPPPSNDPQDMFNVDALIEVIEEHDIGKDFESYEHLKNAADLYHKYRAFTAEGRYYQRILAESQLKLLNKQLTTYSNWLKNAKKDVAKGNTDPQLLVSIKKMEEFLISMNNQKAKLELEVAAMQPHISN